MFDFDDQNKFNTQVVVSFITFMTFYRFFIMNVGDIEFIDFLMYSDLIDID